MWSVLVSILVTYAYICFSVQSTSGSRPSFAPHRMLSYHIMLLHESIASVKCLMPGYYRCPPRSTSELLRTL